jgi:ABC-type nitrate/sulfonate/bicarbonate transport system ATPase subunit
MLEKIQLRDVTKSFTGNNTQVQALDNVNMGVSENEFVTIIGPSGCGKSTLFNIIAGLLQPTEGQVIIDGRPVTGAGHVAYMLQKDLLLPWRTVLGNVILGRELAGERNQQSIAETIELLPKFGLEQFADAYPFSLSGGMRQRAALMRTMMCKKEIILLDEPFGALDALTRLSLQEWLLEVFAELRRTILFITHDIEESVFLSDRVFVMSPRPGTVYREYKIDLPKPRNKSVLSTPEFMRYRSEVLAAVQSGATA